MQTNRQMNGPAPDASLSGETLKPDTALAASPVAVPVIQTRHELVRRAANVGLKLADLAERAGVSRTTVMRLSDNPQIATLRKLTNALIAVERQRLGELMRLHGLRDAA